SYSNPTNLDAASVRVDHTFTSKLTLFGRYNYAPSETRQRGITGVLNNVSVSSFNTQTVTLGLTQAVNSKIRNDLRANYSRNRAGTFFIMDSFGGATPPPDSLLFPPFATRQNATSLVRVGPFGYVVGGDNAVNFQHQFNLVDNLIVAAGTHQLKFGVDYRRLSPIHGQQDYIIFILFN